ncbi:MAG: hypothetical protein ACOCVB_02585 [Bacillota bacterium]
MEEGIEQLIKMVANLKVTMEEKFERIDSRFDRIEQKLAEHDEKFEKIEQKLDTMEEKQLEHDRRFDKIENKFINTIKVIGHDVQNNKKHIERLENNDDYYRISE